MFDFLRNLTKSAEEKRQEMMAAYLDGVLSPAEQQQFEEMLAQDPGLQTELEQQRAVKQMLSQIPQRRVPRNFTLDPARYGRPARQPLIQYYPALQAATVLTAVLLFFIVGLGVFTSGDLAQEAPAASIAQEPSLAQEAVEVTRVVTQVESEEAAEAAPAEAPAEEAPAAEAPAEEVAEEEMMEEAEAAEEPLPLPTTTPGFVDEGGLETEAASDAAIGEGEAAPATAPPEPTPSPLATQSTPPRVVPTEAPDRSVTTEIEEIEPTMLALEFAATELPSDADRSSDEVDTAVTTPEEQSPPPSDRELINPITLVQIGLVVLLIVLVALTLYARRQFS